jgi:hypothetical protein
VPRDASNGPIAGLQGRAEPVRAVEDGILNCRDRQRPRRPLLCLSLETVPSRGPGQSVRTESGGATWVSADTTVIGGRRPRVGRKAQNLEIRRWPKEIEDFAGLVRSEFVPRKGTRSPMGRRGRPAGLPL